LIMKNVFDALKERGFVANCTHEDELRKALEKPVTFYLGIDPTADNLHIGHWFGLRIFKIFQDFGHNGIILIGNATATVGDPSFKNDMRKMLSSTETNHNAKGIAETLARFIDLKKTKIVYNADWLGKGVALVDFMQNIGAHFNISEMLAHECYKNRLGNGLTFLELGYMLMQAYDFVHLNESMGCILQIGGSDQWANILAGVELGRKIAFVNDKPRGAMFALCYPLLTNSDGQKMGKTEKGALWLDAKKTSAYDFFQYFINVDDKDVEKLLTFFTDISREEIHKMCKGDIIAAKRFMATNITEQIHGKFELETPSVTIKSSPLLVDILVASNLAQSKREARELIQNGAIILDDEKITDINFTTVTKDFTIKKGKKTFLKICVKS